MGHHDLVFSTIRGGFIGKNQVAAQLQIECEKLGLKPLTPHGLRHLCASLLPSENLPLLNVSARLGHADPTITARIYSQVVKADTESGITVIRCSLSRDDRLRQIQAVSGRASASPIQELP